MQTFLGEAEKYEKSGNFDGAYIIYDRLIGDLMQLYMDEVRKAPGTVLDEGVSRKITPKYFSEMKKMLQADPQIRTAYYRMGLIDERRGNYSKAIENYIQAIDLTPENEVFSDAVEAFQKLASEMK